MVKEFIGLVLSSFFNNKILNTLFKGYSLECLYHLNRLLGQKVC